MSLMRAWVLASRPAFPSLQLHTARMWRTVHEGTRCCTVPPGHVGVDPSQPAQDVQDEALGVFSGRSALRLLTESVQQFLVELQEMEHSEALDPGDKQDHE